MAGSYFYGFKVGGKTSDEVLKTIAMHRQVVPRATWTDVSKLHVTLKFIGKTLPANMQDTFARLCTGTPAFKLTFRGAGVFNNKSGPRVLFTKPVERDRLAKLHEEMGGYADSFTPHLTLAKLEDIGDAAPEFAQLQHDLRDVNFGVSLIDELALYQTQGEGKPYKVVMWHRLLG